MGNRFHIFIVTILTFWFLGHSHAQDVIYQGEHYANKAIPVKLAQVSSQNKRTYITYFYSFSGSQNLVQQVVSSLKLYGCDVKSANGVACDGDKDQKAMIDSQVRSAISKVNSAAANPPKRAVAAAPVKKAARTVRATAASNSEAKKVVRTLQAALQQSLQAPEVIDAITPINVEGLKTTEDLQAELREAMSDQQEAERNEQEATAALNQRINDALNECNQDKEAAANSCNPDSAENASAFGQVKSTASGIVKSLGAASAGSISLACSEIGKLSLTASSVLGGYQQTCKQKQASCQTSCSESLNAVVSALADIGDDAKAAVIAQRDRIQENINVCKSFDRQAAAADQTMQETMATARNASNCQNQTAAADYCKSNPTAAECKDQNLAQSCADPETAKSTVCVCFKNPAAQECSLAGKTTADGAGGPGGLLASGEASHAGVNAQDLLGEDQNQIDPVKGKSGPGEEVSGSKGGAAALAGSGAGGAAGSKTGGKGGDGKEKSGILSGFFGGGGGGGMFGGLFGGSEKTDPNSRYGSNGQGGTPDLKKYMPGGLYDPKRSLAGGGRDGIQGKDADLFKIIKHAYQKQNRTLND